MSNLSHVLRLEAEKASSELAQQDAWMQDRWAFEREMESKGFLGSYHFSMI